MHEGKALKAFVKAKHYTQEGFADLLNVSRTYITQMYGKEKLPNGFVDKVNDAFKIDFRKVVAPAPVEPAYNFSPPQQQSDKALILELEKKIVSLQERLNDKDKVIDAQQKALSMTEQLISKINKNIAHTTSPKKN